MKAPGIDPRWIVQIRSGDASGFEALFHAMCPPLLLFARRYVGDIHIAENIVQDVFLKLWSNRTKLKVDLNIKTYLYTSVKNNALNHLRHVKIEHRNPDCFKPSTLYIKTPYEEFENKELESAIRKAIDSLPEKCRIIFSMNRLDRLTYSEIAEIQNISIKTVETQMGRALKHLRNRLAYLLTVII